MDSIPGQFLDEEGRMINCVEFLGVVQIDAILVSFPSRKFSRMSSKC